MVLKIQTLLFTVWTPRGPVGGYHRSHLHSYPEDGGSIFFRNRTKRRETQKNHALSGLQIMHDAFAHNAM
jgi:hypothetical protein